MGSSLALRWANVHEGVMRRSEAVFAEVMWTGMSRAVRISMMGPGVDKCFILYNPSWGM
jgi:hypothetical protein